MALSELVTLTCFITSAIILLARMLYYVAASLRLCYFCAHNKSKYTLFDVIWLSIIIIVIISARLSA